MMEALAFEPVITKLDFTSVLTTSIGAFDCVVYRGTISLCMTGGKLLID